MPLFHVPTGYGDRVSGHPNGSGSVGQTLAEIEAQIDVYAETFGDDLEGIFFDEAAQSCSSAATDFAQLSDLTRAAGLTWSAFNPGWVGDGFCYVDATPAGDVVITFENALETYLTNPYLDYDLATANTRAHARGVRTWHLVNKAEGTAGLSQAVTKLRERVPDFAYVTDIGENWQAGENTWGSPPSYWDTLINSLS